MANEIQRHNNMFDDVMSAGMRNLLNDNFFSGFNAKADHMKTDIAETDKNYVVKVDMPGFDKKDIHINYESNILTITGRRDTFDDLSDKDGNILHSERNYGQMSRSFRLPEVDLKKAVAHYSDGVLVLTLPKLAPEAGTGTHIEIE